MWRVVVIILLVGIVQTSQGRKCWRCDNARSNYDCLQRGHLQQCLVNQEYCQNEIRAIAGGRYFEVTKRCKQDNGCSNNRMQNYTGTVPFQCEAEEPHSVCRCCCGFDNCNGPNIVCIEKPPSCPSPDPPINGFVSCPSFRPVGTSCQYRCMPGYQLEGDDMTRCEISRTEIGWTNPPPQCVVKPCQPLLEPEEGSMFCTDEWNIASECTFSCNQGRVLVGQETLKCSIFSIWDGKEPTCAVVECFPPRPLDPNFVPPRGECTDEYKYQSTCSYTCDSDYDLVGIDQITCGPPIGANNRATWSDKPPRCQIKQCEPPYPECTGNEVGDTCQFSCERCERLEGPGDITCTRNGWSDLRPTCVTISCAEPPTAPGNGDISCNSALNQCDDSCRFVCDSGYRLVGSSQTTCLPSGEWSNPTPICELAECDPIDLSGIQEQCSDGYNVGSTCALSCEGDGMEFVGENRVRCKKDPTDPLPIWEPSTNQYCRFILCPNFPAPGESPRPDAGSLTCGPPNLRVANDRDGRSGWRVESECDLTCNQDFKAKDITENECTADGQWTVSRMCCVECVTNTALDVVVLLDRTEEELWDSRLAFLGRFLDFITFTYEFNLNITFIPFGDDVDYANDIDFMPIDDEDNNVPDLSGGVDFLSQRPEFVGIPSAAGQDSNSGKALQEVIDNIFGFYNFRVPMIFLVTTRAPSDLGLARQAVQELQKKNIHLRIFPIVETLSADPGVNKAVFESMVESPDFVVDGTENVGREEDFYIMAGDQLITVTRRVCNERAQGLQQCLFDTRRG